MVDNIRDKTFLYPTDTTFGLGCDAFNRTLVEKIFTIKERPKEKTFLLLVDTAVRLMDLVEVPDIAWDIMEISEKPVTIVYDRPIAVPEFLLSEEGTIAIRLTNDRLCKGIIQKIKKPIISTSANLSQEPNPEKYADISEKIISKIDYIFPECKNFVPKYASSSIIGLGIDGQVKVIRE